MDMRDAYEETNATACAVLVQRLNDASAQAVSYGRASSELLYRAAGHIDWAYRMIIALRNEVRKLGGDPDTVRAE